jgi:uncharacterized membrane protein
MNILLSPNSLLFWTCTVIMLPMILLAIRFAPWKLLFAEQQRQHFFFATIIVLAIIWMLQIRIMGVLAFHPLLVTVVTMIFGWSLALVIGLLALLILKIIQLSYGAVSQGVDLAFLELNLSTLPVDFCLSVLVPVSWALLVIGLVNRWKFKNPFTYIWGVGFFGAMISCLLTGLAAILLFSFSNSEVELNSVMDNFIIFFVMTFPEGFINGSVATMFTIFYPELVKTYRDDWFLKD